MPYPPSYAYNLPFDACISLILGCEDYYIDDDNTEETRMLAKASNEGRYHP